MASKKKLKNTIEEEICYIQFNLDIANTSFLLLAIKQPFIGQNSSRQRTLVFCIKPFLTGIASPLYICQWCIKKTPNKINNEKPVPPAHIFPPTCGMFNGSTFPCLGELTSNPLSLSTVICKRERRCKYLL